ncbi:MAG: hypothetical protein IT330_11395 [Anaerolineae bacterium]|nr:hypothetical protein [Anaerolineae bacterium]
MANQRDLEILVGKALLHDGFRYWLFTEPEAAAESVGVSLTEEQASHLRGLGPEMGDRLANYVREPVGRMILFLWGGKPTWELPPEELFGGQQTSGK